MKTPMAPIILLLATTTSALAQTATTGSQACSTIYQQASDTVSARIAADDQNIAPPQSLKALTCLDNILKGSGLDVVVNLLDPSKLFDSIQGQICNAAQNAWKKALGGAQCGITLTGFNLGTFNFGGGLGSGLSCPKLTFGGGGPPIGYIGIGGPGASGALTVQGSPRTPTGYSLPNSIGLW